MCLIPGSGSGAAGLCTHRIGEDFGFLSPAARPPAAAGQPGLQSGDHLPNQRAGQPGTRRVHAQTHRMLYEILNNVIKKC